MKLPFALFWIASNLLFAMGILMVGAVLFIGPYEALGVNFGFTDHAWGWTGFIPWFERVMEFPVIVVMASGFNYMMLKGWQQIDCISNRDGARYIVGKWIPDGDGQWTYEP
jgi:hypothetical protein